MNSTHGRPRSLTDAQVKAIMTWYYSPRTVPKLAKHMNLPVSTIQHCIEIRGRFKQASPELRQEALKRRRRKVARLRREGWM